MNKINQVVESDFKKVNNYITCQLSSRVELVENIGNYIIQSGGKRIRPLLTLLVSGACGYQGSDHIRLAATIEFLHTASLLHDDVVDMSKMRRGQSTANAKWGNAPSVLVGDFLYSRAFQTMVSMKNLAVMEVLADATNCIAEGEVQQLIHVRDLNLDENTYFDIIYRKTARLFEAASHTSALLLEEPTISNPHDEVTHAMQEFGKNIGMVFQLADDVLDYTGKDYRMGKNAGDDLAEGKVTLPLIHALRVASTQDSQFIREAIQAGSVDDLMKVVKILQVSGSIEYTQHKAALYANQARENLTVLPQSPHREAMEKLTYFAMERHG